MRTLGLPGATRAVLAGLTILAFATPLADGIVCAASAGRMAEMRSYQHATGGPSVHVQLPHKCRSMSCCRVRPYTPTVPAAPFALEPAPSGREGQPTRLQGTYFTFLATPLPPPRG